MAKYNVTSGQIQVGFLYKVIGVQSVIYNSVTYATGAIFRGVSGVTTFAYSGSGTQIVNQLIEFLGSGIEYISNSTDLPTFPESTILKGFAVEFVQSGADIQVSEITILKGFAVEFVDFPIYAFTILTRRL